MSISLATRGIIAGFGGSGSTTAVPVCDPELTAELYGDVELAGESTDSTLSPSLRPTYLAPNIKISVID